MPEQFTNFDPKIYSPVAVQTQLDFKPKGAAALTKPQVQVPVEDTIKDSRVAQDGRAVLAANNVPESSMFEGLKATAQNLIGTKIWDYIQKPNFEPAGPGYNVQDSMDVLPLAVSPDESEWLRKSRGIPEFNWAVAKLKEYREQSRIMGEHGAISGVGMLLDPTFLPLTVLSGGAASLVAAGRLAQRGVAGGVAAGLMTGANVATEATRPVTLEEYVTGAIAMGALTAMAHSPRAKPKAGEVVTPDATESPFKQVDEAFPSKELHEVVAEARERAVDTTTVSHVLDETSHIPSRQAVPEVATPADVTPLSLYPTEHVAAVSTIGKSGVPRPFLKGRDVLDGLRKDTDPKVRAFADHLRAKMSNMVDEIPIYIVPKSELHAGREFYSLDRHAVFIYKDTGPFTKLHEMTHALTAHKIEFGLANPDSAHGKLVLELEGLRTFAKREAKKQGKVEGADVVTNYFNKDLHEFVAGLFSGTEHFTALLSRLPAPDGGNMLAKVVKVVRKLLGFKPSEVNMLLRAMDISDKLMSLPLNVTMENLAEGAKLGDVITGSRSLRLAPPTGNPVQVAGSIIQHEEALAARAGGALAWNLFKTLAAFSDVAKKAATTLLDDPLNMVGDSAASQKRAIRADLDRLQAVYEQQLLAAMAEQGAGVFNRTVQSAKSSAIQSGIESAIALELDHRSRYSKSGYTPDSGAPKYIKDLADAHGATTRAALLEGKRSGVLGADTVDFDPGYFRRQWNVTRIEGLEARLVADGHTPKGAKMAVTDLLAKGMVRANGWDAELARDIAGAIIQRTKAKGYFEDNAFRAHAGNAAAKEVRGILEAAGLDGARLQRALDVLTGVVDEAGKLSSMKHRIDIDMTTTLQTPGGDVAIHTLIDTDLNRLLDSYVDNMSGQAALARKGLGSTTAIDNLRTELAHSIPDIAARERAINLFDDSMKYLLGHPTGEKLPTAFRNLQALNRLVGLSMSGIWQAAETSVIMARYGLLKTLNYTLAEMPGFREFYTELKANREVATDMRNLLAGNASQDLRLRPYIRKFEDNFEMPMSDNLQLALSQGQQLVPYINGMKFIHHKQAQILGNLVTDTFVKAAKGNLDAVNVMQKYGLEGHVLDKIKGDITEHGTNTAKWSAGTWESIRGPLTKMMDEAALRNRLGEIPAFAQFTASGKFVFTFRSFVLGAHNKILAGTLHREGLSGYALLMLYQFPMNMVAVTAANTVKGKPPQTDQQLINGTFGQMGAMGLLGEIYGIASGDKQQSGSSGLIFVDRLYKIGNAAASGNAGNTAAAAVNAMPIISIIPGIHALSENLKDKQHGASKSDGSK